MITLTNLSKNFDKRMLMDNVSLSIFPNEKIGLTGPNGAGKTTLFSIILGQMQPTAGQVQIQKNIKIGFLPQEARFESSRTVLEEMTSGDQEIQQLVAERTKLEDENKADTERYGDILERLDQLGIYELEHKAEKILSGLGFKQEDVNRPIVHLSGGWQMRTLLAKLLTYQYDLLLLDEPTNYLDLEATIWLKGYLADYKGTFVLISHDKKFLNDVTNYTIVLDEGRMVKIKGNYEEYEEAKAVRLVTMEKQKKVVDKKREQLERFTQRFHAQPNLASAVRNKRKMLERMEEIEIPPEKHSIKDFEFIDTKPSGYSVITLEHIAKSYAEKKVYTDLNMEIIRGQKLCLVGPNGAGKSTFLKIIAGVLGFDAGTRKLGHQVELGYFSQTRLDVLSPNRSALDELLSSVEGSIPAVKARTLLGIFNFRGDDVFKPVSVLSGGEKSRLILAKLLINPPNFICLDEPTTHLDIDGVEALTKCFKAYKGTLCFISHDLFFVEKIANHIIEVKDGVLNHYHGGLDYYLDKKAGKADEERQKILDEKKEREVFKKQQQGRNNKESHALDSLHDQHKKALKRMEEIKKEIRTLEAEDKELETESYVKSRVMSEYSKVRDPEVLKEYGRRLKDIQTRHREIASFIQQLNDEKQRINK